VVFTEKFCAGRETLQNTVKNCAIRGLCAVLINFHEEKLGNQKDLGNFLGQILCRGWISKKYLI